MASITTPSAPHPLSRREGSVWTAQAMRAREGYGARSDMGWLTPLFALFIAKQLLLIAIVGPFTGHDEVDHFYYTARFADGDGLGVVGEERLPDTAAPYEAYVADYPFNAEVIQPPLYHVLLAPLYKAIPGGALTRLYVLRAVSVMLGAMSLWLVYLIARTVFRDVPFLRIGMPVFVAFQPQFSFEAAIVNHDVLVILLFTLTGFLIQRGLRREFTWLLSLLLGLTIAAGLWTKVSFGLIFPMVGAALLFAAYDERRARQPWLRTVLWRLCFTVILPLVLIMPWFVRSYYLYGDPTGAQRLREIPEYGEQAQGYREMATSAAFWQGRLEDFWGNYGWRQVPFDPAMYQLIWLAWAISALGLLALAWRSISRRWTGGPAIMSRYQARSLAIWSVAIVSVVYGVLYIGTIQFTQSRFAFPAMAGFAMLTLLGWVVWIPRRFRLSGLLMVITLLTLLNVLVTIRYLIPYYYGPGGGAVIAP